MVNGQIMTKMDQSHPLLAWLKARGLRVYEFSVDNGWGPSTAGRWIRNERTPAPEDQQKIAELTKDDQGVPAVPVSVWHEWALKRPRANRSAANQVEAAA